MGSKGKGDNLYLYFFPLHCGLDIVLYCDDSCSKCSEYSILVLRCLVHPLCPIILTSDLGVKVQGSVCATILAVVFERNKRNCPCGLQNTINVQFYILGLNRGSFRFKTFIHFDPNILFWKKKLCCKGSSPLNVCIFEIHLHFWTCGTLSFVLSLKIDEK